VTAAIPIAAMMYCTPATSSGATERSGVQRSRRADLTPISPRRI
jgi:hypothetical protein